MAKKAVATFSGNKAASKNVVKCIRMVKSSKTDSYVFEEGIIPTDQVKDFFNKK